MAVGSSETIRVGSLLIVTLPLAAASVVGKTGTRIDVGRAEADPDAGALAAAVVVLLLADEQAASAAAAATATSTVAESRWGVLIECYFLRYGRGGRRDRRPIGNGGSRRTGRSALPTRVDVVRRG